MSHVPALGPIHPLGWEHGKGAPGLSPAYIYPTQITDQHLTQDKTTSCRWVYSILARGEYLAEATYTICTVLLVRCT